MNDPGLISHKGNMMPQIDEIQPPRDIVSRQLNQKNNLTLEQLMKSDDDEQAQFRNELSQKIKAKLENYDKLSSRINKLKYINSKHENMKKQKK